MTSRCLAAGALLASIWAARPDATQTFSSRVDGVRVDVLVTDGRRLVAGLRAADFELRDSGVVQTIAQIDVEQVPLNVIAVFDVSSSVRGARLRELVAAARAMVRQLHDRDRIALVSFASRVALPLPLTADRAAADSALVALDADGLTALRDAAFAGLALREADAGRTLMLIFSDGDDTASWLGVPAVIDAAQRSDVVAYAVQAPWTSPNVVKDAPAPANIPPPPVHDTMRPTVLSPPTMTPASSEHMKFLRALTSETGGSVTQLESDKGLTNTFASILGEFRDRYVLSYVPAGVHKPGWHELTVRVKGRSVKVTARRGYVAR
jgi:VWFA-related protein